MHGMTTVVVVHESHAPDRRGLVALCDEHVVSLRRAAWAQIDELVGFSTVLDCEACALIGEPASDCADMLPAPALALVRGWPSTR